MLTSASRSLILLAEDDALTRVLLTRALRQAGYAVAPVARADELLSLAFGLEPAITLLVLDLLLGGYDSSQLLPLLRPVLRASAAQPVAQEEEGASESESLPAIGRSGGPHAARHIPAILISVHPDLEQVARRCGADAWLPKPVQPDALVATVRRVLGAPPGDRRSAIGGRGDAPRRR